MAKIKRSDSHDFSLEPLNNNISLDSLSATFTSATTNIQVLFNLDNGTSTNNNKNEQAKLFEMESSTFQISDNIGIDTIGLWFPRSSYRIGSLDIFTIKPNDILPRNKIKTDNVPIFNLSEHDKIIHGKKAVYSDSDLCIDCWRNGMNLTISSLPGFYQAGNISPVSLEEARYLIYDTLKLELDKLSITVDFDQASIFRLDVFVNLRLDNKFKSFLPLFESITLGYRMKRINDEYRSSITWGNKYSQFQIYDKVKQLKDTGKTIVINNPDNTDIMRIEFRSKNAKRVKSNYSNNSLEYLLSEKGYSKMQAKFIAFVNSSLFNFGKESISLNRLTFINLVKSLKRYVDNGKSVGRFFSDLGRQYFVKNIESLKDFELLYEREFGTGKTARSRKNRIKKSLAGLKAIIPSNPIATELFELYKKLKINFQVTISNRINYYQEITN